MARNLHHAGGRPAGRLCRRHAGTRTAGAYRALVCYCGGNGDEPDLCATLLVLIRALVCDAGPAYRVVVSHAAPGEQQPDAGPDPDGTVGPQRGRRYMDELVTIRSVATAGGRHHRITAAAGAVAGSIVLPPI